MKLHGNAIPDPEKLSREIAAETALLKQAGKIPDRDERLDQAFAAFAGGKEEKDLLALAREHASVLNAGRLSRRAGWGEPLIRAAVRILAKIFRDQEIFNALILEILREQEKRIALLEKRAGTPENTGKGHA